MSKLLKIIDKDLMELIQLFGGFQNLKKIVDKNPEAKSKLEKISPTLWH